MGIHCLFIYFLWQVRLFSRFYVTANRYACEWTLDWIHVGAFIFVGYDFKTGITGSKDKHITLSEYNMPESAINVQLFIIWILTNNNTVWAEPRSRNRILPAPEEPTSICFFWSITPRVYYSHPRVPSFLTADDIHIFPLKMLQHSSPQGLWQFIFPQVMHKCTIFPSNIRNCFLLQRFVYLLGEKGICHNLHFSWLTSEDERSTMAHIPYIQMRKPQLRAEQWCCPSQFNTCSISVFSTVPRGLHKESEIPPCISKVP